ncbi:MAG: LuxR C-terminal-related transcriptional regulator [Alteripontixanthobacter sp.]
MSKQFEDFLTQAIVKHRLPRPDVTHQLKLSFLTYLHACGIEYTNYGAFQVENGKAGKAYFADTNFRESWIEEYFAEGYTPHDYVLGRAKELDTDQTFHFALGEWLSSRVREDAPQTAQVLRGAGDAGMRDGFGLIGRKRSAEPGGDKELRWSFGFGGEMGVGAHIERQISELTIASALLIDLLMPEINANLDRILKPLSPRERDVLACFANGLQRDRAAYALKTSVHTIDFHCRNLRKKLRASTMAEAVAKGYRYGQL